MSSLHLLQRIQEIRQVWREQSALCRANLQEIRQTQHDIRDLHDHAQLPRSLQILLSTPRGDQGLDFRTVDVELRNIQLSEVAAQTRLRSLQTKQHQLRFDRRAAIRRQAWRRRPAPSS